LDFRVDPAQAQGAGRLGSVPKDAGAFPDARQRVETFPEGFQTSRPSQAGGAQQFSFHSRIVMYVADK
jgi:hypothetical protein